MKKLMIALSALAVMVSTPAVAQHHRERGEHHQRYEHRHHNDNVRFGISIFSTPQYSQRYGYYSQPYGYYGQPYGYYRQSYGYYGVTYPTSSGYVGCRQYGNDGLLVDRYGRLVRNYEFFTRANVRCETDY